MYSHNGASVNMLLHDDHEMKQWQEHMAGGIQMHRRHEGDTYMGKVAAASCNPADVVPAADLILIIVPAFAHRPILT